MTDSERQGIIDAVKALTGWQAYPDTPLTFFRRPVLRNGVVVKMSRDKTIYVTWSNHLQKRGSKPGLIEIGRIREGRVVLLDEAGKALNRMM